MLHHYRVDDNQWNMDKPANWDAKTTPPEDPPAKSPKP